MADKRVNGIISLVGPKHTGKSSIGRLLANLTQGQFVDLDDAIESRTGKSVRALYQEGVEIFRSAELETVEYVLSRPIQRGSTLIVATGGGIIDNERAFSRIQAGTYLICLDVSAQIAWERIEKSSLRSGGLPLFLRTDNPMQTHKELHDRRMDQYKSGADVTIATETKNAARIADEIFQLLIAKIHYRA